MGATTAAQFAGKLRTFSGSVPKAAADSVVRAAAIMQAAVAAASGTYAGRRIVQTRATFGAAGGQPQALVKMTSRKAHLLDHDTKPHVIRPRRKTLLWFQGAEHPFPVANHPKTTGKLMFERGRDAAIPLMVGVVGDTVGQAMVKAFGL